MTISPLPHCQLFLYEITNFIVLHRHLTMKSQPSLDFFDRLGNWGYCAANTLLSQMGNLYIQEIPKDLDNYVRKLA
ncbi:MAG: hypothetical protein ACFWTN_12135 [Clostridium sp.]|jgi:hypothetical protein